MTKTRRIYLTTAGKAPYEEWLDNLGDMVGRAKIKVRIERATLGNFGDHRAIGGGVLELKINYGPGYRVYLGLHGSEMLILLCGGDKSTQETDITKAHSYWKDYKRRI
jgi:putative addiction module killer protein